MSPALFCRYRRLIEENSFDCHAYDAVLDSKILGSSRSRKKILPYNSLFFKRIITVNVRN